MWHKIFAQINFCRLEIFCVGGTNFLRLGQIGFSCGQNFVPHGIREKYVSRCCFSVHCICQLRWGWICHDICQKTWHCLITVFCILANQECWNLWLWDAGSLDTSIVWLRFFDTINKREIPKLPVKWDKELQVVDRWLRTFDTSAFFGLIVSKIRFCKS